MRLIAVLWIAWACTAAAQEPPQAQNNVVVTVGEATIRRAPDRAFVTVAVETRAKSPRDAQRLNTEAMTAVQQRLTQARLAPDALRTTGYDLQQEFDFVQGKRVPREFVARNGIEVRLDDIARTGEVLDAVVQSGATSVSGIRFDLKDRDAAEREALRLAVADARARADAAASGAGRSVDRVLRVEDVRETAINPPRPVMRMMAGAAESTPQTPIEPGMIEIHARVTLTAQMR
jgi:uncharacterized protein YggE